MSWVKRLTWLLPILVFIALGALYHFGYPNINDGDSFYHIRHAEIYRTNGLLNSSLPWASASVIKTYASDIWYGFHILLIPFTYAANLVTGIRWAGLFLTAFSLSIFYLVIKKLGVRFPFFWSLLLTFSSADMLFRLAMMRPHILTFAFSILLLYALVEQKIWLAALAGFAIAWIHLSLSWVIPIIAAVIIIFQFLHNQKINWWSYGGLIAASLLGWLARPNPLGALKLAYIQVVELMLVKQARIPLRFGAELGPVDWSIFTGQLLPLSLLLLTAAGLFMWLLVTKKIWAVPITKRIVLWTTLALSTGFFILSIGVARRSIDLWTAFTIIFIGLVCTEFITLFKKQALLIGSLVISLGVVALSTNYYIANLYRLQAIPQTKFQAVSGWLQKNTKPQDVVVNTHWDNFGPLFLWNSNNYYINGMDPIFAYTYSEKLYWEIFFPETDQLVIVDNQIFTCPQFLCKGEGFVNFHNVLKTDFNAKYILVESRRNPLLKAQLDKMRSFKDVFHTEGETLYQIL